MSGESGRTSEGASPITAHDIAVERTARYFTLGPTHGFPRELWIVCHGYAQLGERFLRQFTPVDDGARLVVAPEALSRFYLDPIAVRRHQVTPRVGATWMTREAREAEIADYVGYLERVVDQLRHRLAGAAPRLVVLGFSQGTATVCRWLNLSRHRPDHLILWSGTIPPEIPLAAWSARLGGASLTLVAGDEDAMVPPASMATDAERLAAAGIAHELLRHPGGHLIERSALQTVAARIATISTPSVFRSEGRT